jgi:hypothetical protein
MATPSHLQRAKPTYDEFTIGEDGSAAIEVVSRKATAARAPASAEQTLIPRKTLDDTTPMAKAALAILCWANSIGTSALTGAQIQIAVLRHNHPGMPTGFPVTGVIIGSAFQLILTFAQVYTAERSPTGYKVALTPDALMTAFQWGQWLLYPVLIALLSLVLPSIIALGIAIAGAIVGSWVVGVWSAKLPERLVFGPRRV